MQFNVGCLNASNTATRVDFEIFAADGTMLGEENLILLPWSNDQLKRIFDQYHPVTGHVDFWSAAATGQIYCYGSVLDNVTSDPTTIPPMQKRKRGGFRRRTTGTSVPRWSYLTGAGWPPAAAMVG